MTEGLFAGGPTTGIRGAEGRGRNHIHFVPTIQLVRDRTPGLRHKSNVLVMVDMQAAMKDGIKFFVSQNRVVLTRGKDGVLPPKYIQAIVKLDSKRTVLWRPGWNKTLASSDHLIYVS